MMGDFRVFGQHAVELAVGEGRHLEKFGQGVARILSGVVCFLRDAVELAYIFQPVDMVGLIRAVEMCLIPNFNAAVIHDGRNDFDGPNLVG